jgi:hypothetical protein
MVLTLDFLAEDLAQTRLACSPLWETIESLRMRQDPAAFAVHEEWVRVSEERLRGFDFSELLELVPAVGYIPDFLTPPPQAPMPSIADELAELEATPAAQVRADLADRFGPEATAPEHFRRWLARPAEARDHIVRLLREYWERAVAPNWPRIRALHEAELESRARQQARQGTGHLLGDLHPAIAWRAGTLRVRGRRAGRVALGGRGLVVISSVFVWPLACSMVALRGSRRSCTRLAASAAYGHPSRATARWRSRRSWGALAPRSCGGSPRRARPPTWHATSTSPRAPCRCT